jgi:dipeptidase E
MTKNIFISGGGNEIDSEKIDIEFAKYIDGKKLMYIPIALNRDSLGFEMCYDWITKLFLRFKYTIDVPQIHMYMDPVAINEHIFEYDALYIGGGNTFKLLDFLYKNNLFEKVKEFYESGRPIYGGSAGGIILGNDIRTVEEENDEQYSYSRGFDVLQGTSFICHYEEKLDSKIMAYVLKYKQEVIALPEESGLQIVDGEIKKSFGEVFIFTESGKTRFLSKKKVIVCDYDNPKKYTFPSFGFGSSEKRIWHFAKTLSEIDGYEVIITGPLWLPEYVPNAKHFPKRLDVSSCDEFLKTFGKCDYLFAGHEYFDKDEWVEPFEKCAEILLSYQLHPYKYKKISFNQKDKFLFCYSDEILKEYTEQKPLKALLFHSGVNEDPYFTDNKKDYLLWIGRLDQDKVPHYAILAAEKLGMKIKILGKTVYQPEYFEKYKALFSLPHVEMMGVVFGREKMKIISEARCAIYSIDKNYHEAGAGVLGEILSSGVPIAGMSWTGNDAVCEAVDNDELGAVVVIARSSSEEDIVDKLSKTISKCLEINSRNTFNIGSKKYDPKNLVSKIFKTIDDYKS